MLIVYQRIGHIVSVRRMTLNSILLEIDMSCRKSTICTVSIMMKQIPATTFRDAAPITVVIQPQRNAMLCVTVMLLLRTA